MALWLKKNARLLVLSVFVIEIAFFSFSFVYTVNLSGNASLAAVLPNILNSLTNQNRQSNNESVLTVSPLLNKVAELKAEDMAQSGYFAHTSPSGKTPWFWFNLVGYKYQYAGENLAVDFTNSVDVDNAWMSSLGHRENILKENYTEVGTAVATGTYQGSPTTFVVQVFGKPISQTAPMQAAIASSTPDSPQQAVNIILVILGLFIIASILIKVFIKIDKKHPVAVTSGLIIIVVLLGFFIARNMIVGNNASVYSTFAGFHGDQFDQSKN